MLLRASLATARRRPTENPHFRLSNRRFVRYATAQSLSYVLSLPLPAQRQIRTPLRLTHKKKAVSFENGYQTWGGGMKNLFRFSILLISTFLSKSLDTYEEYHLFSVVG